MEPSIKVVCEICQQEAEMVKNVHIGADGNSLEWPKATVKSDGIYFTIACPVCGEREQCMAKPGDTE
jgi:hypothetical protein